MTFVDIAGIVKGASEGAGLGNKFLANIRECDAICQVVRVFADDDVVHVDGKVDPKSDIEVDRDRADPGRPADPREGGAAAGEGSPQQQGPQAGARGGGGGPGAARRGQDPVRVRSGLRRCCAS